MPTITITITITINIAARGTPMSDGKPSVAGHIWMNLDNGLGNSNSLESYGWGPEEPELWGKGKILDKDSEKYLNKSYSRTINISQAQYDSLRVDRYFYQEATYGFQVEQIRLADGTILDVAAVKQLVTIGTEGDDVLHGYASADTLNGLAGNDVLDGKDGDDHL